VGRHQEAGANALTIVPSGLPVAFPSYSRALDFELELGVGDELRLEIDGVGIIEHRIQWSV
jgi:2-keto-4-pentenoate hydratase/2-oxohepta-3-ene-1,7-dioic acid hydratase in catechol pathway